MIEYKLLEKPLTASEVTEALDTHGYLTAVVSVGLSEVMNGVDALNELFDELILDNEGILCNISYRVVGLGDDNDLHFEVVAEPTT